MPKVSSPQQLATVAPQRRRTVPAEPDDAAGSRFGRLEVVADLAPVALAGFDARREQGGAGLVGEDVTADVARLHELARLATCDGLTGLLNRSAFHTRLRSVLGDDDVAGRVGGDEFAVLSRSGGRRRAAALASRVQRVLDAPVALGAAGRVQVTATVGHAVVDGSLTAAQAFAAADADMYSRKWTGRERAGLGGPARQRG